VTSETQDLKWDDHSVSPLIVFRSDPGRRKRLQDPFDQAMRFDRLPSMTDGEVKHVDDRDAIGIDVQVRPLGYEDNG
jgi:hypothetical protein